MLKKLTAIFFFNIYLFNLAGYSILFKYFIDKTNKHTIQQLDNGNYDESELFEIKVSLHLPYFTNLNEYERYDGEIELNGVHYSFVKRKVLNDTLYLLCLPNHAKTELCKAKNEFAAKESANEPKKGTESHGKKNAPETQYDQATFQYGLLLLSSSIHRGNNYSSCLTSCFVASPAKPPECFN